MQSRDSGEMLGAASSNERTPEGASDGARHALRGSSSSPLCIVGIGASAGGLDALERFFDNVPKATGMAFVVVQHLSPDFRSMMDELLARHTDLPVQLVQDRMVVEPDRVYLIPPGKEMIISGGRLLLSERDKQQELSLPIDVFFRSLAQDCGPRAAAIVLSGGGSDGSRGVRAVHEAGGLVIVQNTQTAQFDGMPRTARDAGVAHWVLAPHDMPRVLLDYVRGQRARPASGPRRRAVASNAGIETIYQMLEREYGIDFTDYKPSTVTRRIERRLALARLGEVDQYVERLKKQHDELDVLYRDLLIGVTRFFRNEEAFAILEGEVLPDLFRRGPRDAPIRAWIAGCATGEEAYSVAIVLHEAAERFGKRPLKIFATDVHRGSLECAARGAYDESAVSNVSPERLERYFQQSGRIYQVIPDIRQMIVFAQHNVIKDAPFTRVDLVTCRNLLIYLQPPAQRKALSLFHFALNRGGTLFLGPSESPGTLAHDYETLDLHWRMYRKFSDVRVPIETRVQSARSEEARLAALVSPGRGAEPFGKYSLSHLLGIYDSLLETFIPTSLLLNDRGEIVHAFGGASRYLRPRDGRQGLDVIEQVEPQLKMVLVGGLKRALAEPAGLVFNGVHLTKDDGTSPHRITLRRIASRHGGSQYVLVSFEPAGPASTKSTSQGDTEFDLDQVSREQLGNLAAELSSTKENLQAAIEELEASNEELQASNEELLASNEELQSTNEELQSVNEELYTVNTEHQRKIDELTELTNDMDNLLSSTEVGTIFLDKRLAIRKFTPHIARTFNLLPHDVGRTIDTFAHATAHPELVSDLAHCLATGERVERELHDLQGKAFFMRVLPYRAKGTIDGVVLTLIDTSGLKAAEDALFQERHLFESLLASVPDAIYFKDVHGRFIRANDAMAARLGVVDPRVAVGKTAEELVGDAAARAESAADEAVIRADTPQHYVLERRHDHGTGDRWDNVTRLPLRDTKEGVVGVIGIYRDVTKEKRDEERVQEGVRRRDQFLAMLSHELRNPLGAVVSATRLLRVKNKVAEQERFIGTIERQAGQMARLLDDLLEASRVTQNKIELRCRVLDLRLVAREAADAVRAMMDSRGVTLAVDVAAEPVHVNGDPARLQQIQVNLLNNAAKYTPRGGHVWLSIGAENGEAVVRVRDDGAGIAQDLLDSVFELFVQSNRTLDRADGGLGVGLTLVRALVALHGGVVTADSGGAGHGSEFVVRLPLAPAVEEVPEVRSPRRLGPGKGTKVVIIEDNDDSRDMLCALLGDAGFHCQSASTGPAGLALIDELSPASAVVDVGLPGLDGLELARRVRSNPKHAGIFLIALTGYGQPADRVAAHEAGFDGHLVKPVDFETLLSLLSDAAPGEGKG
jgi:two-component system, chemotaxis family, CheB/CheR fusion protein